MKKFKAVIFDMDGTLLDSEPLFLKADLAVVAAFGGFMSEKEHDGYIGIGNRVFLAKVKEMYNIDIPLEELVAFQENTYMEIARADISAFPEMVKFATWVQKQGMTSAIASGSAKTVIDELTAITGVQDLFDHRISSEEVENGKPEPDVFLETARRLGLKAEDCLVIEDSPYGVEAAYRAGMNCVAVPMPVVQDVHSYLPKADLLFEKGMQEFSCDVLLEWLGEAVPQL
ncbi:MAG: hypothetical protein B6241_14465, partial [Spirochaetaceae bacterium 4572_59]